MKNVRENISISHFRDITRPERFEFYAMRITLIHCEEPWCCLFNSLPVTEDFNENLLRFTIQKKEFSKQQQCTNTNESFWTHPKSGSDPSFWGRITKCSRLFWPWLLFLWLSCSQANKSRLDFLVIHSENLLPVNFNSDHKHSHLTWTKIDR